MFWNRSTPENVFEKFKFSRLFYWFSGTTKDRSILLTFLDSPFNGEHFDFLVDWLWRMVRKIQIFSRNTSVFTRFCVYLHKWTWKIFFLFCIIITLISTFDSATKNWGSKNSKCQHKFVWVDSLRYPVLIDFSSSSDHKEND